MSERVLLVEDEEGLVVTLTDRLRVEGYDVVAVRDGDAAVERGTSEPFDLIVLDVMLPGKSGFDVCRELRGGGTSTPILFLSARGELTDRVLGLKLGGDDYLTKPFEMLELTARVEALLRRSGSQPAVPTSRKSPRYQFDNIDVDFRRAELRKDGEPVELSALELKLLHYFIEHRGATLSRDELLRNVWEYDAMPYSRTVDVHVSGLRQKIEETPSKPRYLVTVHGLGYKFVG